MICLKTGLVVFHSSDGVFTDLVSGVDLVGTQAWLSGGSDWFSSIEETRGILGPGGSDWNEEEEEGEGGVK